MQVVARLVCILLSVAIHTRVCHALYYDGFPEPLPGYARKFFGANPLPYSWPRPNDMVGNTVFITMRGGGGAVTFTVGSPEPGMARGGTGVFMNGSITDLGPSETLTIYAGGGGAPGGSRGYGKGQGGQAGAGAGGGGGCRIIRGSGAVYAVAGGGGGAGHTSEKNQTMFGGHAGCVDGKNASSINVALKTHGSGAKGSSGGLKGGGVAVDGKPFSDALHSGDGGDGEWAGFGWPNGGGGGGGGYAGGGGGAQAPFLGGPSGGGGGASSLVPAGWQCIEPTTNGTIPAFQDRWFTRVMSGEGGVSYATNYNDAYGHHGFVVLEYPVTACSVNPCQHRGICVNTTTTSWYCQCIPGFTGLTCQFNVNECASNPCQNGGSCVDGEGFFTCECAPAYTGRVCEHASCRVLRGKYFCGNIYDDNGYATPLLTEMNFNNGTKLSEKVITGVYADGTPTTPLDQLMTCFQSRVNLTLGVLAIFLNYTDNSLGVYRLNMATAVATYVGPTSVVGGIPAFDALLNTQAVFVNESSTPVIVYQEVGTNYQITVDTSADLGKTVSGTAIVNQPPELYDDWSARTGSGAKQYATWVDPYVSTASRRVIRVFEGDKRMRLDLSDRAAPSLTIEGYLQGLPDAPHTIMYTPTVTVLDDDGSSLYGIIYWFDINVDLVQYGGARNFNFFRMDRASWNVSVQWYWSNFAGVDPTIDIMNIITYYDPLTNLCQHGGSCAYTYGMAAFQCTCPAGFSGELCEININECASVPCRNGATCVDGANAFTCMCPPGYSGTICQTEINECASNPCQHGGTCADGINSFVCTCQSGYTGSRCETDVNECASQPCANGATCLDRVNSFTCACVAGYSGTLCQTALDPCASAPCLNGGKCKSLITSFVCTCPAERFNGTLCETSLIDSGAAPGLSTGSIAGIVAGVAAGMAAGAAVIAGVIGGGTAAAASATATTTTTAATVAAAGGGNGGAAATAATAGAAAGGGGAGGGVGGAISESEFAQLLA